MSNTAAPMQPLLYVLISTGDCRACGARRQYGREQARILSAHKSLSLYKAFPLNRFVRLPLPLAELSPLDGVSLRSSLCLRPPLRRLGALCIRSSRTKYFSPNCTTIDLSRRVASTQPRFNFLRHPVNSVPWISSHRW